MAELQIPTTSAEEIRRATEAVLSRPEFRDAAPTWWQRAWRAVLDFIAELIDTIGAGDRGSVIGTVVLVLVALAAAALIVRFTRTVRRDRPTMVAVDDQLGRSPADWAAEADEHATHGRWREAVRCRYRQLLAELASAHLVEEVAGRTAGEYLQAVAADLPDAAADFAEVTRRFETAWYGHAAVTAAEYQAHVDVAGRVAHAAGVRRRVAVRA